MGVICPKEDCKREFDSVRGMKQHHYGSHNEKIGRKAVTCDWCGEKFEEWESELNRNKRTFCDNECFGKWQSEIQSGKNNPNWLGGKIKTHTCEICGSKYNNYKVSSETRCCSRECYAELLKERTGEDCPAWKGGAEKYYGNSWSEQRRKTIERDNNKCKECGMPRGLHKNNYEEDLHVHHIKPYRTFEDDEAAHQLDNLVSVCRECHYELEHNRNL